MYGDANSKTTSTSASIEGGMELFVEGTNFDAMGSSVMIGGHECPEITGSKYILIINSHYY